MNRYKLAVKVGLILLSSSALTAPALAQEAGQPATAGEDGAGEIIVTAQRRSESLQKVPIAVTAITADSAQKLGIQTLSDIQLVTPGASFSSGYTFAQLYIRGIGAALTTSGLENPVSVYYDGAYIEHSVGIGQLLSPFDVGSIQVLRGPQGTLYGRNATGGAVLIDTANPTNQLGGLASAEYGRFNSHKFEGMLNVPVSDSLALRVAGRYEKEDGYITNLPDGTKFGGQRNYGVRAKALWTPIESVEVLGSFEYSNSKSTLAYGSLGDVGSTCLLCSTAGITTKPGYYEQSLNGPEQSFSNVEAYFGTLRVKFDTDTFNITSTSAYRKDIFSSSTDQDFTPLPAFQLLSNGAGGRTFTQELQVASNLDGQFNFLAGVSYMNDNSFYDASLLGFFFPIPAGQSEVRNVSRTKTNSWSGFLEGTYSVTDRLKITAGGRYTSDHRDLDVINSPLTIAYGQATQASFQRNYKYDAFTPRFVVAYDAGKTNLYYSYSRGFKSGGIFSPVFLDTAGVQPEKAYSHEIGLKNQAFGGKLTTNIAAFYMKNKNLQVTVVNTLQGGSSAQNAGATEAYGLEADMQYRPMAGLSVGGTISYLHSRFESFPNALVKCVDPTPGSPLPALFNCAQNLAGVATPQSPTWTVSFNASYDFPIGTWSGNLAVLARYSSEYSFSPGAGGVPGRPVDLSGTGHTVGAPVGYDVQDGYTMVNVSGYLSPPGENFRLGFYVNNLLNEKYAITKNTSAPFGMTYGPAKPITYGVRASYRF